VQCLRNKELEQAQASGRPQVWRAKQTADRGQPLANIQMDFLLPSEFRARADQEVYLDFNESEYEEIVAKLTVIYHAIFDKPVKHRHLKALYVKGFVYGKPVADPETG
jgi:chloramphenicol 3-O-phosphotransferase